MIDSKNVKKLNYERFKFENYFLQNRYLLTGANLLIDSKNVKNSITNVKKLEWSNGLVTKSETNQGVLTLHVRFASATLGQFQLENKFDW